MAEETSATETNAQIIATVEQPKVAVSEDLEAKVAKLEAEKAAWVEKSSNYQLAYLKEHAKNKEDGEGEEAMMRRIASETLANSEIIRINKELEETNKKALRELKEAKLALANKSTVATSASVGSHSEGMPVRDTLVTDEQMAAFKARGWSDKDIERYKRNLQKNAVR